MNDDLFATPQTCLSSPTTGLVCRFGSCGGHWQAAITALCTPTPFPPQRCSSSPTTGLLIWVLWWRSACPLCATAPTPTATTRCTSMKRSWRGLKKSWRSTRTSKCGLAMLMSGHSSPVPVSSSSVSYVCSPPLPHQACRRVPKCTPHWVRPRSGAEHAHKSRSFGFEPTSAYPSASLAPSVSYLCSPPLPHQACGRIHTCTAHWLRPQSGAERARQEPLLLAKPQRPAPALHAPCAAAPQHPPMVFRPLSS